MPALRANETGTLTGPGRSSNNPAHHHGPGHHEQAQGAQEGNEGSPVEREPQGAQRDQGHRAQQDDAGVGRVQAAQPRSRPFSMGDLPPNRRAPLPAGTGTRGRRSETRPRHRRRPRPADGGCGTWRKIPCRWHPWPFQVPRGLRESPGRSSQTKPAARERRPVRATAARWMSATGEGNVLGAPLRSRGPRCVRGLRDPVEQGRSLPRRRHTGSARRGPHLAGTRPDRGPRPARPFRQPAAGPRRNPAYQRAPRKVRTTNVGMVVIGASAQRFLRSRSASARARHRRDRVGARP
jgi:hypothetical protein